MTPSQIIKARRKLGLSATDLARTLRLEMPNGYHTVKKWQNGSNPISGPASLAIDLLLAMTSEQRSEFIDK